MTPLPRIPDIKPSSQPVSKPESSTEELYQWAAEKLDIEVELIDALAEQESLRKLFNGGQPTILFEPRVFTQLLNSKGVDVAQLLNDHPRFGSIITYHPVTKYGSYRDQWKKFNLAAEIDEATAIEGCSWGTFSVMGYHWEALGYESAQALRKEAETEAGQFRLMLGYLEQVEPKALEALRVRDWQRFKVLYNGPGENDYAAELAQRYRRALARRGPKKSVTKGASRTVNAQVADVAAKVGIGIGGVATISTTISQINTQLEQLPKLQSEVDQLSATVSSMGWMPWAIGIMALVMLWPNIRSLYAYLHDNGFILPKKG